MIISLISGGVSVLNAAGFLLMSAGPELLEYIVISTIFSVATWIYSWILPAAISYREDLLPQLRLLQALTVVVAAAVILFTHPGPMALLFVAMMAIDAWIFPQYMLLMQSRTGVYLRMELVRGLANSVALLAVLLLLDGAAFHYVELLLVNVVVAGVCLAIASVHRPPSVRLSSPHAAYRQFRSRLFSRQLVALLSARVIESGTMMAFSQLQSLSLVLSLKIGFAVSSALSANARQRSLPVLWLVHLMVYGGGTAAILVINHLDWRTIAIPDTLALITGSNAVVVIPVLLVAFTLTVLGLRMAPAAASRVGDPGDRP